MNSRQRAYLRGLANKIDAKYQYGKDGMSDNFLKQLDEGLEAKELIKVHVLENSLSDTRAICDEVCERLGAGRLFRCKARSLASCLLRERRPGLCQQYLLGLDKEGVGKPVACSHQVSVGYIETHFDSGRSGRKVFGQDQHAEQRQV